MTERARPRASTRTGVRKAIRAREGTSIPIDDAQLVEEAELTPVPRATVAIHETSAGALAQARAALVAWGYEVVIASAGAGGAAEVVARLTAEPMPAVVLVGLPGGEVVLDAARALEPRRPVLVAAVAGTGRIAAEKAHAAGADLVALRPHEADRLGPVMFAAAKLAAERATMLTARGNEVRLRDRLERVGRADTTTGFHPFELFQRVLELEIKRARRYAYPLSVCLLRSIAPARAGAQVARDLRVHAATAVVAAIRDIDLPVEIADDRFLVLLPYTDADSAALVAQRIVAAVAASAPVRGAGHNHVARVIAGVAGVVGGGELSFARLMRDATSALAAAAAEGEDVMIA